MTKQAWTGWRPIVVLLLLLILWECMVKLADIPHWLLPPPTVIVTEAITGWANIYPNVLSTIRLAILGLLIGSTIGLLTAILLHLIPILRESVYPLVILSQNVPIIVLAPLLVIWFGFGLTPKLIVLTLVCFFPITVAAMEGFRQTSPELKQYMMMAGATTKQLFFKLELPNSLPYLFSGLKISATYSVMGAVISEWLGAKAGLGVYMTLASSSFRTDRVFVAIMAIMIISLLFFGVIVLVERWLIRGKKKGVELK